MHIELKRDTFTTEATLGKLYIDGKFICHTLEDVVRKAGVKVAGKTAIPKGTYPVTWEKSPRLSKLKGRDYFTPRLHDVPGFSGILIHSGNTAVDSDGCILVGLTRAKNFVGNSRDAVAILYDLIAKAEDVITITVS